MNSTIIAREIKTMEKVYEDRIQGDVLAWSPFTRCKVCGEAWMWAVRNNLDFICHKCV